MGRAGPEALTQLAYAAALDDELWTEWSEKMMRYFSASGAVFGLIDLNSGRIMKSLFLFPGQDVARIMSEYAERMAALDPILRRLCSRTGSEIFSDQQAFDRDCPRDREYMRWQVDRIGIRHNLTASVVIGDGLRAGIALNRSPDAGAATPADREAMTALFPDMARALALGLRHHELLQSAWWEGIQAGRGGAAVLIDEWGSILRLSAAAESFVSRKDGLTAAANHLGATNPACDQKLQAALAGAIDPLEPRAGTVTIARASGRPPYHVAVYPLARPRRFLAPHEAAALIRIADPAAVGQEACTVQRALFGLTDREREVAALLLSGHSLESLAAALNISHNTVRNHLQSLFRKTATSRQSDLIRLLMATREALP